MTSNDHYSNEVAKVLVQFRRLTPSEIISIIHIEAQQQGVKGPRKFAKARLKQVCRALKEHGATIEADGSATI